MGGDAPLGIRLALNQAIPHSCKVANMRFILFSLSIPLLLSACGDAQKAQADRARNMALVEGKATGDAWNRLFTIDKPNPYPRPVAPAYCYKLQTDTLCYRNPQAGMEGRLVGQQPLAATVGWVPVGEDGRPAHIGPQARIESGGTRSTAKEAYDSYVSGYSPVSNNTIGGSGVAPVSPARGTGPRVLMAN